MSEVWITKNGFRATEWCAELRQNVNKPIAHIFQELRCICHIEDGVTLGDVFSAVENSRGDLKFLLSQYSWCDVDTFHREAQKLPISRSTLKCIIISKRFVISDHGCAEYIHVDGAGGPEAAEMGDGKIHYAVDFTPANELVHLPVQLASMMLVRDERDGRHDIVAEAEGCFSLLEVLSEIYFEIGFHGAPEERNEKLADVLDAMRAVEDGSAESIACAPCKTRIH